MPPDQEKAPCAGRNGSKGQASMLTTTTGKRLRPLVSISQGHTLRGSPRGIATSDRPTLHGILHAPLGKHVSTSTLGTR
jgi:hypothetical protein